MLTQNLILSIRRIEQDAIQKAVYQVLEDLNAKQFFQESMVILLKPNVLGPHPPERAVTTHPEVVRFVIRWVKQFNPKKIYVGDSSGGKTSGKTVKALEISGIKKVCDEEGAIAIPLEKTERRIYQVPNSLVLKEIASTSLLKEADLIINLPKIKTHELTGLTCAIKNMFGTVLLINKMKMHARFTRLDNFHAALADIYSVSQPQLTIVDGYLCQEGRGPAAGDVVKLDLIIGGYNGFAVDQLVCKVIGLNPQKIPYLQKGTLKGIGPSDLLEYEIKGCSIQEVFRLFKPARKLWVDIPLPKKLAKFIANTLFHSRITISSKKCKLCGTCWENCPVNALTLPDQNQKTPKWKKKKCITCYCCAELCPYEL